MEAGGQEVPRRDDVPDGGKATLAEAAALLSTYDAMFHPTNEGAGGPVMVSASNAQRTLHDAQRLLEPLLGASPASLSEEHARARSLLADAFEKEAVLLRQLSKAEEDSRHNRFLFLYQSSVVFEKAQVRARS